MAGTLQMANGAAPAAPGAGYTDIYPDTGSLIHVLTSAGADTILATTAAVWGAANITDGVLTNAKLANVATSTIKGRATAGTGVPEDLTVAQVATLLAASFPAIGDAAWTDMTLGANWAITGTMNPTSQGTYTTVPGYRKVGGVVYLRGTVNCDASYSTPMATLAAGYRPASDLLFVVTLAASATPGYGVISILTTGAVMVVAPNTSSTYHFSGVCFPAA